MWSFQYLDLESVGLSEDMTEHGNQMKRNSKCGDYLAELKYGGYLAILAAKSLWKLDVGCEMTFSCSMILGVLSLSLFYLRLILNVELNPFESDL